MSVTKAQLVGGVGISTVGDLSVYGGVNATGVITATSFSGDGSGLSGISSVSFATTSFTLSGTPDIDVRNITGVAATFTGNVSIAGTLTYEDVTNVDSVGLITARSGVVLTGGDVTLGTGVTISGETSNVFTVSTNGSERIRVDSSGRLAIGTTSPGSVLTVEQSTGNINLELHSTSSGRGTQIKTHNDHATFYHGLSGDTSGNYIYYTADSKEHVFSTANAEAVRIDSSQRLLVGTSTNSYTNSKVEVFGGLLASSEIASRIYTLSNVSSANPTTVNGSGFNSVPVRVGDVIVFPFGQTRTVTAVVSDTQLTVNSAWTISFAGSNVTGYPSLVFSTTADGASSPTERMRIDSAGNTFFNTTNITPAASNVAGMCIGAAQGAYISITRDGTLVAELNRKTSDGAIINFLQDGVVEGDISVSGTTVSYNGAHLSRWSQLVGVDPYDKTTRPEILRGTVMSNLDEMCDWTCPTSGDCQDNEQLNKTEISSVDDDPNVAGVFQSWDDDDDTWVNDFYLAMTGDFVIRIAAGTTVQRGDLLCSAGDGTARPQGDRYIKDSTIAKVTSTTLSCTHPDGSYCVPCVLMAC